MGLDSLGCYNRLQPETLDSVGLAAAGIAIDPFGLAFERAQTFSGKPGHHPFVLLAGEGAEALITFHTQLGLALKKAGLGRFVSFDFKPHVTLFYADRHVEDHPVDPISWKVKEFALVLSHVGEARYDILGQWALSGHA